jgi:hypothetical protein
MAEKAWEVDTLRELSRCFLIVRGCPPHRIQLLQLSVLAPYKVQGNHSQLGGY